MSKKPLCAMDRNEMWCVVADNPPDATLSVETACGEFIVLPHGLKRRAPTCSSCRAALSKEPGDG